MLKRYIMKAFIFAAIVAYMLSMIVVNLVFDFSDIWEHSFKSLHKQL